jgi:hypothetical protein
LKDDRHSSQIGTLLAVVSSLSQMRHPAGKNTLTMASLTSASQPQPGRREPRTLPRRSAAAPLDEGPSATRPELYSSLSFN